MDRQEMEIPWKVKSRPAERDRNAGGGGTAAGRGSPANEGRRLLLSLMDGLERSWPLSVALMLVAFVVASLL